LIKVKFEVAIIHIFMIKFELKQDIIKRYRKIPKSTI
jgi:hypothetical protein